MLIFKYFAFLIGLLLLVSCVPAEHKSGQASQGDQPSNAATPVAPNLGVEKCYLLIQFPEPTSNQQTAKGQTPESDNECWALPYIFRKSSLTDWLLVAITVVLARFAIKQSSANWVAARAARVSAIQAERAANHAERTSLELARPFLWTDKIEIGFNRPLTDNPLRVIVKLHIKNSGSIPAIIREYRSIVHMRDDKVFPEKPDYEPLQIYADHRFIAPGDSYEIAPTESPDIQRDFLVEWKLVDKESPAMHFYGRVIYDDIRKIRRTMGFSFFVHPMAGTVTAVGEAPWNYW